MSSIPAEELEGRFQRLTDLLTQQHPHWELAVVTRKVSQYYMTGTIVSGSIWIPRNRPPVFFVKRGLARAQRESAFPRIEGVGSFREIARRLKDSPKTVFLETQSLPLALFQGIDKYFHFEKVLPLDPLLFSLRAVKSGYEMERMARSGAIHAEVMEEVLPELLREGMSEAELAGDLFRELLYRGSHGVARVNRHDTDMVLGYVCFGENSLQATGFDGPDGALGQCAAVPFLGSPHRRLRRGDLVFVDIASGFEGYHTDKTGVYSFGAVPSQAVQDVYNRCIEIEHEIAERTRPGAIPSEIYRSILDSLDDAFLEDFMGFQSQQVRFLGHGVGLHFDEYPVLAEGFEEPLKEDMVLAVEPKKGMAGIGLVGLENTFRVTPAGGVSLTGTKKDLFVVET